MNRRHPAFIILQPFWKRTVFVLRTLKRGPAAEASDRMLRYRLAQNTLWVWKKQEINFRKKELQNKVWYSALHTVDEFFDRADLTSKKKPAIQLGRIFLMENSFPDSKRNLPVIGQGLENAFCFPLRDAEVVSFGVKEAAGIWVKKGFVLHALPSLLVRRL